MLREGVDVWGGDSDECPNIATRGHQMTYTFASGKIINA